MSEYVNRLIKCGYSPTHAYATCQNFIKEFSLCELVKFIVALEEENAHVD